MCIWLKESEFDTKTGLKFRISVGAFSGEGKWCAPEIHFPAWGIPGEGPVGNGGAGSSWSGRSSDAGRDYCIPHGGQQLAISLTLNQKICVPQPGCPAGLRWN